MPCAAIDLFCGVGGLTKGLEQAGINVVAGIDFEASCQYAYEENNNAKFIQRDITTVLPEELAALYLMISIYIFWRAVHHASHFQNILKDTVKMAIKMKSGDYFTHLERLQKE